MAVVAHVKAVFLQELSMTEESHEKSQKGRFCGRSIYRVSSKIRTAFESPFSE